MPMTFAEKVLAQKAGVGSVVPGETVTVRPDRLLMHDDVSVVFGSVAEALQGRGVAEPEMPVIVLDRGVCTTSEEAREHRLVRQFVERFGLPHFFDVGWGICHQVMMEERFVRPGLLILGAEPHTCTYGALGALAMGIDLAEAASLLLVGQTTVEVPSSVRVVLRRALNPPACAKDLALFLVGLFGGSESCCRAIEFHGSVGTLSVEDRMTIANMGAEMGAKIAVFPVDHSAREWLSARGLGPDSYEPVWADIAATYERELSVDLAAIVPLVAMAHTEAQPRPVTEVQGLPIHQALLGTCTNGRLGDLSVAAAILEGKKVATGVRLLVVPASREVLAEAVATGIASTLIRAGAILLPPGCGSCVGAHQGALAPGERCISSAGSHTRCEDSEIVLASPATVAASALTGVITDPREVAR